MLRLLYLKSVQPRRGMRLLSLTPSAAAQPLVDNLETER